MKAARASFARSGARNSGIRFPRVARRRRLPVTTIHRPFLGAKCGGMIRSRIYWRTPLQSELRFGLNLWRTKLECVRRSGRSRSAERVEAHLISVNFFEPSFSPKCGQRAP